MYRFFTGIVDRRWNRMGGVSAARVPGLAAAAAVLATAATSVGFTDKLHPLVSPMVFYPANPCVLPSTSSSYVSCSSSVRSLHSGSACLPSASGRLSTDSSFSASFPWTLGASSARYTLMVLPGAPPLRRPLGVSSALSRGWRSLSCSAYLNNSSCLPSVLYSPFHLSRDELHRPFSEQCLKLLRASSSAARNHTSYAASTPSSPDKTPLFDTFDLSSHLATFLSLSSHSRSSPLPSTIPAKSLHRWHTRAHGPLDAADENGTRTSAKPKLTVVLLGWLGSQQKHLRKYAEWYNARGIDAVTFTLPMGDILSLSVGGRAEEQVEQLTGQLSAWLSEETKGSRNLERQLMFHTFSNTGWLTYGVVLENLSSTGNEWVDRIKGCVIDSAPAADLDPQIWASGFSAALLKKRRSASDPGVGDSQIADATNVAVVETAQPHVAESALLALLEKFFSIFLRIPSINQRLSEVVTVLSKQQPPCPQLYIYSTADKVIPVNLVESFMEKQRQQGRIVRGCNFQSSPHVDHFRSFPEIYGKQVTNFLEECLNMSPTK